MDEMLSTDNWCIKVAEKVYGPYTQDQMGSFAAEGRLSATSLVAPAGSKVWREARQYPSFASVLSGKQAKPKAFGKGGATSNAAREVPEGAEANFVLVFDNVAGTAGRMEPVLRGLGTAFRMAENVWVLTSTQSVLGVKNAVAPNLQVREFVFICDCTRGRTSWANFVPELHAKLTRAWIKVH
ncbi:GYF domain-containing protein [Parvularcula sp. LCG005]|uniref:GYF domain-containing protein n=1 Tax=Parvularcula sp. LCG005 TaxID=3078805 RepID=UPI0029430FB2|nr:GYF domain-containing protein [Parvularcula sp. LCG005]WOI54158.1 GYF domain-containing protein [Parvularcula sp. LCG005]